MKAKQRESVISPDEMETDVQTVMARIRESMVEGAFDDDVEYPTYALACARAGAKPTRFAEEMYYQLEQANLNADQVLAEVALVESQVPILGVLINRFKRELHRLVVFYVNMVAERQVTVNDAVVKTLNSMMDRLESPPEPETEKPAVEDLQCELSALRARLARLEAQAAGACTGE